MIEEIVMHVAIQLAIASFVVYVAMHKDTKLYICMTSSDHNNAAIDVIFNQISKCSMIPTCEYFSYKTIHLTDYKDNNNSLQINLNVLSFIY